MTSWSALASCSRWNPRATRSAPSKAWRTARSCIRCSRSLKLLLQRMQLLAVRHAFDGADLVALGFHREHEARADQLVIERDRTGAAIAGGAAFLGTGEIQGSAQGVEHGV